MKETLEEGGFGGASAAANPPPPAAGAFFFGRISDLMVLPFRVRFGSVFAVSESAEIRPPNLQNAPVGWE